MTKLLSYNQMEGIFGKDDKQVQQIRKHLDCINPNKNICAESHNNSLEAFRRMSNENYTHKRNDGLYSTHCFFTA